MYMCVYICISIYIYIYIYTYIYMFMTNMMIITNTIIIGPRNDPQGSGQGPQVPLGAGCIYYMRIYIYIYTYVYIYI